MTIEEAIRKINYGLKMETTDHTPFGRFTIVNTEALQVALAALRAQQKARTNEPLTLDELRQMDGEPVYVLDNRRWAIVRVEPGSVRLVFANLAMWDAAHNLQYGIQIYRRAPAPDTEGGKQ